jgi:hypothetical protein
MSVQEKVSTIFRELAGEKAERLDGRRYLADVNTRITAALLAGKEKGSDVLRTDQIGFHLVDWQAEAAFLVALALYPERFTDEEIQDGVEAFLIHAPSHVVEAARIAGYSTDMFSEPEENPPNQASQTTAITPPPSATPPAPLSGL